MRHPNIGDAVSVEITGDIIQIRIDAFGNKVVTVQYQMKPIYPEKYSKDYVYEHTIEVPLDAVALLPVPDFDVERLSHEGAEK